MKQPIFVSLTVLSALTLSIFTTEVWATNEGSHQYGYWLGSQTGPQYNGSGLYPEFYNNTCSLVPSSILDNPKGAIVPAVTNTTACENGWFVGYKNWCINHAVNCVGNITIGIFPPMLLQAREQYLAGAKAANGSGISMCPIGNSQAFCTGWDSNNGVDYGYQDCGDIYNKYHYTGPFSNGLVGCPLDVLKPSQMAEPRVLIGTWHYVNESSSASASTSTTMTTKKTVPMTGTGISGKIVYSKYGNFTLSIPNSLGDYRLEGSWGYQGHNILTECYAGGCENNTLTTVTPNHIEFTDNHGSTIHLFRLAKHLIKSTEDTAAAAAERVGGV